MRLIDFSSTSPTQPIPPPPPSTHKPSLYNSWQASLTQSQPNLNIPFDAIDKKIIKYVRLHQIELTHYCDWLLSLAKTCTSVDCHHHGRRLLPNLSAIIWEILLACFMTSSSVDPSSSSTHLLLGPGVWLKTHLRLTSSSSASFASSSPRPERDAD